MLFTSLNNKANRDTKDIIGCVGKLPVQAEFIHCNVDNQNLKLLESWLQEGFVHTTREQLIRNQGSQKFKLAHGLLLNYGIGRKPIIACIYDSQDSYGRNYPLLLFQELNDAALLSNQQHIPLLYKPTYQAFSDLLSQSWVNKSQQEFIDQLLPIQTLVSPFTREGIQQQMLRVYSTVDYQLMWQQIMGLQSFRHASQLLAKLVKIARSINSQGTWQITLPIAKSQPAFLSIGFWLSLLHAMRAINYRNMHLSWPLDDSENDMNLTIYHGNLSIAFFRSLLNKEDARITQMNPTSDYLTDKTLNAARYEFSPQASLQQVIDEFGEIYKELGLDSE